MGTWIALSCLILIAWAVVYVVLRAGRYNCGGCGHCHKNDSCPVQRKF